MQNNFLGTSFPEASAGCAYLRVAKVVRAHGIKGGLKLKLYTDNPKKRFIVGNVFVLERKINDEKQYYHFSVTNITWQANNPIVYFNGIDSRNEAEDLIDSSIWFLVNQENDQEEDAWFYSDLQGLNVVYEGKIIGEVLKIENFPAQDILFLKINDQEILLPFVRNFVSSVDIQGNVIEITPPEGLLPENN